MKRGRVGRDQNKGTIRVKNLWRGRKLHVRNARKLLKTTKEQHWLCFVPTNFISVKIQDAKRKIQ